MNRATLHQLSPSEWVLLRPDFRSAVYEVSELQKRGFASDPEEVQTGDNMSRLTCLGVACCVVLFAAPAPAGSLVASGAATAIVDGTNFDYSIILTNSSASTVSLQTFWFGWVPGEDFLPHAPVSETSPSGWTVNAITHGGSNDGYAIRWEATSSASALTPGNSLEFGFTSQDSPAVLSGDSAFYPGTPIGTAFVYQNGPFVGASDQFIVTFSAVPEPSSLLLGTFGAAASFAYLRTRRKWAH